MKTADQSFKDAINYIKTCAYKGTAIKIELEGELNRGDSDYCSTCENNGWDTCYDCDGTGVYERHDCTTCDSSGEIECEHENNNSWGEDYICEEYILETVSKKAREALIFSRFYNDGSVDSEFTFTLPILKAKYAVEFIKAFKSLADAVGNGLDTDGAGMHIAVLNSPNGNYPDGNKLKRAYSRNFEKSMTHLLPALFFLGSADHRSRSLSYRYPQISLENKHSAISGGQNGGCYEYRVFETCYDHPERILDFICVIAKTLRFYRLKQNKLDFFGKIGKFGFKDGSGLERFYYTRTHLEALRAGVAVLKPEYKTFSQLRKERNFKLTFKKIDANDRKRKYRWQDEWRSRKATSDNEQVKSEAHKIWVREDYLREVYDGNFERWLEREYKHLIVPEDPNEYIKQKQFEFMSMNVETVITV